MKASVEGGGKVTQRFGLPAAGVASLEPAMFHSNDEKAYWLAYPNSVYASHFHPGIDREAPYGDPVLAMEDGTVVWAGFYNGIDGYRVDVEIRPGTRYQVNHLSKVEVSHGQRVQLGQRLGRIGTSGVATGPHTHEGLSIYENGRTMLYNPALFLYGGPFANDPRIQPSDGVRKFRLNGPGINVRDAPPHPSSYSNVFAISRADGIYRRRDGKKIAGLKVGITFLNWRDTELGKYAVGLLNGRKVAVLKSLIHF